MEMNLLGHCHCSSLCLAGVDSSDSRRGDGGQLQAPPWAGKGEERVEGERLQHCTFPDLMHCGGQSSLVRGGLV